MLQKPRVSLVILTFNNEAFVEDAIHGAIAQDYTNLEIIVSDDRSSDGTFSAVMSVLRDYAGPHRIVVNSNEVNLGMSGHFNRLTELTTGDLIVVQAGDDISLPSRVSTIVEAWEKSGRESDLITSDAELMDSCGKLTGERIGVVASHCTVDDLVLRGKVVSAQGCVNAYSRRLLEGTCKLHPLVLYEDVSLVLRAIIKGGILFIPEPLLYYRQHTGSVSAGLKKSGTRLNRQVEHRREKARLGMLLDFRSVLRVEGLLRPRLVWRLFRQIGGCRLMLKYLQAESPVWKSVCMCIAIASVRPRLCLRMLRLWR